MEYLYKGECVVKDRRGLEEMQKLVDMLGITIKLEKKRKRSDLSGSKQIKSDGSEPNLEETVSHLVVDASTELVVDDQVQIAEDILKYVEFFCTSSEDQKCSRCDEWISKENFIEHLTTHKEASQQNNVDHGTLSSSSSPEHDQVYDANNLH